ncbi:MAG: class I SAM-dependent methyltransferase [Candidatus Hadarchaeales archaeon]
MERLAWIIKHCKGKEVLDVGCFGFQISEGLEEPKYWLHREIVKHAKSVLGMDILKKNIQWARKKGYKVVYGDAENFSLGRKFDVIVAGELIEHLSNPGLFLSCAKAHLRSNGILVLTTPNAFFPSHILLDANAPDHVQLYTKRILRQLLEANGFEIVEEVYLLDSNKHCWKSKLYSLVFSLLPRFSPTLGVVAKPKSKLR